MIYCMATGGRMCRRWCIVEFLPELDARLRVHLHTTGRMILQVRTTSSHGSIHRKNSRAEG